MSRGRHSTNHVESMTLQILGLRLSLGLLGIRLAVKHEARRSFFHGIFIFRESLMMTLGQRYFQFLNLIFT